MTSVRKAQASDIPTLLVTLENLTEVGAHDIKQATQALDKIMSQDGHIFVAIKDEEVVGCCTLLIEQKLIHEQGLVGHIEDVATRKGFERQGVGKSVVSAAIDYAKERGCYKVILDCAESVAPFYEKLGFYKKELCMRKDTKRL